MKEYLSQKGVAFEEFDVAVDHKAREEMLAKSGRLAVPTVVVGEEVVVGFDRVRLDQLLST